MDHYGVHRDAQMVRLLTFQTTADGTSFYKVEFTQYQDEDKVTGKVKFNFSRIE